MKKLLLALGLLVLPTAASAQCSGTFPSNTICGNNTAGRHAPFPIPFSTVPVGGPGSTTVGDIAVWNNLTGTLLKDVPPLQIFGTISPNLFLAGPTSGGAAFPTFRAIAMADLGLTASNGGMLYSTAANLAILAGTGTAGQCLLSGSFAAPTWGSCSGAAAVSSVTATNTTLTISPNTGAVLAGLNLSNANNWLASQTITVNGTISANLTINTPGAGQNSSILYEINSGNLWATGLETGSPVKWRISDITGRGDDLTLISNGDMNLMPNGGNVVLGPSASNPTASASYTPTLDIVNTTSGNRAVLELWSNVAPTSNNITSQLNFINGLSPVTPSAILLSRSNGTLTGTGDLQFWTSNSNGGVIVAGKFDWTGNLFTYADAYFGGGGHGAPWVDVKSGANGCAAAVGDGSTNDAPAIQCQITWLATHVGAGRLFFPCSNSVYKITTTLTVTAPIFLTGADPICSVISTNNADMTALVWQNNSALQRGGGMEKVWVQCQQTGTPSTPCVIHSDFIEQKWYDYYIWGGNPAFLLCGSNVAGGCSGFGGGQQEGDNTFTGGNVHTGNSNGISVQQYDSFGNNFYDSKFDLSGQNGNTALYFVNDAHNPGALSENYIYRIDMSGGGGGNYTYSLQMNDSVGAQSLVSFNGAVFGGTNSMSIGTMRALMINNAEIGIGSVTITNGELTVTGSVAGNGNGGSFTFSGGNRSCAGNIGITC